MIDTNDYSLEVRVENNEIRNLGFKGGGAIFLYEGNNLVENIWMGLSNDGQQIVFRGGGDPNSRMAGGGIFISSDDNIVRNNVITGAFAKAVDINSGNRNNVIQNNLIGTRADGTVPTPFACTGGVADSASWYGGWGIALAGTANQVIGNRIAALDNIRSGNDTPPRAIEIFGANHTIRDNIIGVDSAGNKVGVCGQGIKVSDTGTDILDNTIVASKQDSEDAEKAAIITTGSTSGVTVRDNIVEDSPEHIYEFAGTQVPQALRTFKPARITGIDGVNISGASGEGSPCPNCIVDLYRDDADLLDEALEYLGSATADAQGNFTFTLSSPLQSGFGLRTMSTTQSLNVIPGLGSTTTTKNSVLYLPVSAVTVTLPTTGTVGMSVPVTLTVAPLAAGASLTYTIEATGIEDVTGAVGEDGTASTTLTWDGAGAKTVNVTVRNEFSSAVESTQITIVQGESKIFLPGVRR
ncbi:MAG: right-handed parallel beta-helix repeat-containing protein [Caldilineaceae bacterium]